MGYDLEVDAIRIAHEKDLLTAPYVFDVESAVAMTKAGADVLVPHMGLTTKGTIGASTAKTLDESVTLVQEMHDAAVAIRPRRDRALPRRPDRRARGRALRARAHARRQGLLRRLEHGAAPDRDRDDREHAALQGPHLQPVGARDEHIRQAGRDRVDHLDWGAIGWRARPANTGCKTFVVMDVALEPGFGHDFHKHPRAGRDDHRAGRPDRAVDRRGEDDSRGRATPSTSTRTSCTRRSTSATRPCACWSCSRPRSATRATSSSTSRTSSPGPRCAEDAIAEPLRIAHRGYRARRAREHPRGVRGRDRAAGGRPRGRRARAGATARSSRTTTAPTRRTRRCSPTCWRSRPRRRVAAQPGSQGQRHRARADRARARAGLTGRVTCTGGNWAMLAGIHRAEPGIRAGPDDAAPRASGRAPSSGCSACGTPGARRAAGGVRRPGSSPAAACS